MIAENQKVELFDEFYNWLVADGLKAKKSERLHRKKIFASLMANKEMTLDNFNDFLAYKKERDLVDEIKSYVGRIIYKDNHHWLINDLDFDNSDLKKGDFILVTYCYDKGDDYQRKYSILCNFERIDSLRNILKPIE